MKVNRAKLLAVLKIATVGTTTRELLEQSDCFVFTDEKLYTFNGEIMTCCKSPLAEVEGAVVADDLVKLLVKFPDEEVEITRSESELLLKGTRRSAGLTMQEEILLPFGEIPAVKKWSKIPSGLLLSMVHGARICGRDETQPRTTEVHITPDSVEACDNFRLYQHPFETGLKKKVLIPATTVEALSSLTLSKVSEGSGWIHFKTKNNHTISVRSNKGKYPDLTPLLELDSPRKVVLPKNLGEILGRADVMHESTLDASVAVQIVKNKLVLKASKESGWYRESKKIKYTGPPLRFQVHPTFLMDVLAKTRQVRIGGDRMKIVVSKATFVVSLEVE